MNSIPGTGMYSIHTTPQPVKATKLVHSNTSTFSLFIRWHWATWNNVFLKMRTSLTITQPSLSLAKDNHRGKIWTMKMIPRPLPWTYFCLLESFLCVMWGVCKDTASLATSSFPKWTCGDLPPCPLVNTHPFLMSGSGTSSRKKEPTSRKKPTWNPSTRQV